MTSQLLAFAGIALLLIVTPGPDMALIARNALLAGRAGAYATAAGVALGQSIWALATALGIGALLVASEPLFLAVKYAGAAYLVWLGAQALWGAWHVTPQATRTIEPHPRGRLPGRLALRQGLVCNLGNPKMAVFFASFLPQFAPAGLSTFAGLFVLGAIFCAIALIWLVVYASIVAKAGTVLARPRVRRWFESATGAVLIALGLRIATENR